MLFCNKTKCRTSKANEVSCFRCLSTWWRHTLLKNKVIFHFPLQSQLFISWKKEQLFLSLPLKVLESFLQDSWKKYFFLKQFLSRQHGLVLLFFLVISSSKLKKRLYYRLILKINLLNWVIDAYNWLTNTALLSRSPSGTAISNNSSHYIEQLSTFFWSDRVPYLAYPIIPWLTCTQPE